MSSHSFHELAHKSHHVRNAHKRIIYKISVRWHCSHVYRRYHGCIMSAHNRLAAKQSKLIWPKLQFMSKICVKSSLIDTAELVRAQFCVFRSSNHSWCGVYQFINLRHVRLTVTVAVGASELNNNFEMNVNWDYRWFTSASSRRSSPYYSRE